MVKGNYMQFNSFEEYLAFVNSKQKDTDARELKEVEKPKPKRRKKKSESVQTD